MVMISIQSEFADLAVLVFCDWSEARSESREERYNSLSGPHTSVQHTACY